MDCSEARERIAEGLDGELPAEGDLAGHLGGCADCREAFMRMRRTFALAAGAVAGVEPSPASWERLSGEMAAMEKDWELRAGRRRRIAALAAFALPVVAVLVWLLLRR